MKTWLLDASTTWLGIALLVGSVVAVLVVDIGRELTADGGRHPRWIHVVAFVVVPVMIVAAGTATVVRIFTLT